MGPARLNGDRLDDARAVNADGFLSNIEGVNERDRDFGKHRADESGARLGLHVELSANG